MQVERWAEQWPAWRVHPNSRQVTAVTAEMSPAWGTGRTTLHGGTPGRGGEPPAEIWETCSKAMPAVLEIVFFYLFLISRAVVKCKKLERSFHTAVIHEESSLDVQRLSWCFTAAAVVTRKIQGGKSFLPALPRLELACYVIWDVLQTVYHDMVLIVIGSVQPGKT